MPADEEPAAGLLEAEEDDGKKTSSRTSDGNGRADRSKKAKRFHRELLILAASVLWMERAGVAGRKIRRTIKWQAKTAAHDVQFRNEVL